MSVSVNRRWRRTSSRASERPAARTRALRRRPSRPRRRRCPSITLRRCCMRPNRNSNRKRLEELVRHRPGSAPSTLRRCLRLVRVTTCARSVATDHHRRNARRAGLLRPRMRASLRARRPSRRISRGCTAAAASTLICNGHSNSRSSSNNRRRARSRRCSRRTAVSGLGRGHLRRFRIPPSLAATAIAVHPRRLRSSSRTGSARTAAGTRPGNNRTGIRRLSHEVLALVFLASAAALSATNIQKGHFSIRMVQTSVAHSFRSLVGFLFSRWTLSRFFSFLPHILPLVTPSSLSLSSHLYRSPPCNTFCLRIVYMRISPAKPAKKPLFASRRPAICLPPIPSPARRARYCTPLQLKRRGSVHEFLRRVSSSPLDAAPANPHLSERRHGFSNRT